MIRDLSVWRDKEMGIDGGSKHLRRHFGFRIQHNVTLGLGEDPTVAAKKHRKADEAET